MHAIAPKVFATIDSLSAAAVSGAVKVGDQVSVSGTLWDTAGTSLGRVRLTGDTSYLTVRLNGSQGILDALEAVSRDRSAMPVTVDGTLRGIGWNAANEGIDVTSIRIPAVG